MSHHPISLNNDRNTLRSSLIEMKKINVENLTTLPNQYRPPALHHKTASFFEPKEKPNTVRTLTHNYSQNNDNSLRHD